MVTCAVVVVMGDSLKLDAASACVLKRWDKPFRPHLLGVWAATYRVVVLALHWHAHGFGIYATLKARYAFTFGSASGTPSLNTRLPAPQNISPCLPGATFPAYLHKTCSLSTNKRRSSGGADLFPTPHPLADACGYSILVHARHLPPAAPTPPPPATAHHHATTPACLATYLLPF